MAGQATKALSVLLFSITHAGAASAQSPEVTPQQAIDFIKKNVEHYGAISCTNKIDPRIPITINTLIDFDGSNAVVQSKEITVIDQTSQDTVTDVINIDVASVDSIEVKPAQSGQCIHSQAGFYVTLVCKTGSTCVTLKYDSLMAHTNRPSRHDTETFHKQSADILLTDDQMAQRIAKAFDFYRKAVASAPSPF